MNNRLSFAQMLQKKKENDNSSSSSRAGTFAVGNQQSHLNNQVGSQYCDMPRSPTLT
jgi:hypothetical protein